MIHLSPTAAYWLASPGLLAAKKTAIPHWGVVLVVIIWVIMTIIVVSLYRRGRR